MSKNNNQPPPWSEAPPWAKWRAQDEDGAWFAYSKKPYISSIELGRYFTSLTVTAFVEWRIDDVLENCLLIKRGDPNPNWKTTLQKRPENE